MSLIEVLVSMLLLSIIIIGFLGFLDTFSDATKVQGNIADATESLRYSVASLVRLLRMAGTGGLPLVYADAGGAFQPLALSVQDNVDGSATFTYGGQVAMAGTDVLTIRGVINGELFDITGSAAVDQANLKLTIPMVSPYTGNPQTLDDPAGIDGKAILITLQTPLDITPATAGGGVRHYSNYRILGASGAATTNADSWTIDYVEDDPDGITHLNMTGALAPFGSDLAYAAGVLDELTFFISENPAGEPALYRFTGVGNAEELLPNVANIQVALGCDADFDGEIAAAEWHLSADNGTAPTGDEMATLREVRLSVVTRSQDPDIKLNDASQAASANQDASMPENAADLSTDQLRFRHRSVTVRIALRSHPRLMNV
jgi:hypothetical protein